MTWPQYVAAWQGAAASIWRQAVTTSQQATGSWPAFPTVDVEMGELTIDLGPWAAAWPWPLPVGTEHPRACPAHGDVIAEINARRAAGAVCDGRPMMPARPVGEEPVLARAAQTHSDDMAANDFCAHRGSDGTMPEHRIRRAGWTGTGTIGEVAATGYDSARAVVDGWMESAGHCRNLMHPGWRFAGVGNTADAWVVNFSE